MGMEGIPNKRVEGGFTLVELLVVVLIIALLAAIAIPVFLQQRQKAYIADINSALREGATAAEAYGVEHDGNYSGLHGDTGPLLKERGYAASSAVSISVAASDSDYCLTTSYSLLPVGHEWKTATYDNSVGHPSEGDVC
jgi:type IV pilus assembly protein PilA